MVEKVEIGDATLLCGDCLELLPTLGRVDAVVTDPPYGSTACSWDHKVELGLLWTELDRVIHARGAMVFFGAQPFTSELIMSKLDWFKYQWVWDKVSKTDFLNAKNKPMREHEDISVFSKATTANSSTNRMKYNPQGIERATRRKTNNKNVVGYIGAPCSSHIDNYACQNANYPGSILRFSNANRTNVAHPTQKPVELLKFLILTYSDHDDTVSDPFMGSGTTGVACIQLGRKFIGIERERKYFDIACERISKEHAQPRFDLVSAPRKPAEQMTML
jgi:site-specific DNA-methyltransferase (adenine-specific)